MDGQAGRRKRSVALKVSLFCLVACLAGTFVAPSAGAAGLHGQRVVKPFEVLGDYRELGLSMQVGNLAGGYSGWSTAGLPTEA